jgi:hypothetical protein
VVIRSDLDGELKERLCTILLSVGAVPHVSPTLAGFGLERFAPLTTSTTPLRSRPCENASARWVPGCAEP